MRLDLELASTITGATIKRATLKVPDKSTRTSLVILAKKWASLSGVSSTTNPEDINTFLVRVPTSCQVIKVIKDTLDSTYADQMVMQENKTYVWYVPEYSGSKKMKGGRV
jgi:hypothetical protein